MGDSFENPGLRKNSEMTGVIITNKRVAKGSSVAPSPKSTSCVLSFNHSRKGKVPGLDVALFLVKVMALETVRRFSRARCPFVWHGIQALQVLCYPPLKWIQRWAPWNRLVNVMQTFSKPLLVLSIATALSDQPGCSKATSDAIDDSHGLNNPQSSSESRILDEAPQTPSSTNWLLQLYAELEKQQISLPERIDEDELHRFYIAADGDFSCWLSLVKKTIRWRETYKILSQQELEMWSNLVFWHGFDVKYRPCLIVQVGLACRSLSSHERPQFVQAVVSQVEHGILHLLDSEDPRITVLVDCEGLSHLKFPMHMMRSCFALFQDHFPNRLGFLLAIRLHPTVHVIGQTLIQGLKPETQQKLKIEGDMYQNALTENFQVLPSYLGGTCTCIRCSHPSISNMHLPQISEINETERNLDIFSHEGMPSPDPSSLVDMHTYKVLRTAAVGILMFWVLVALIAGIYDPESRPALPS